MFFPLHNAWVFFSVLFSSHLNRINVGQLAYMLVAAFNQKPQAPTPPPPPDFSRPLSWTDFSTTKSYGNRSHDPYIDPKNFFFKEPEWDQSARYKPNGEPQWFLGSHWQDYLTRGLFFSMPHGKNKDNRIYKDLNTPFSHAIAGAIVAADLEKATGRDQKPQAVARVFDQVLPPHRPITILLLVITLIASMLFYKIPGTKDLTPPPAQMVSAPLKDPAVLAMQQSIAAQTAEIAKLKLDLAESQRANQAAQLMAMRDLARSIKDLQHQYHKRRK